jgi:pyruvate kinase
VATLLDTKGPEIRTAMLRGGNNITLDRGQSIIVQAVGDNYTTFEGYNEKLCSSVAPGCKILLADGTISIEVKKILSPTELEGTVLNKKELGQRKNVNLPGVHVDLPVLNNKDIDDLQKFGCKHDVDFVVCACRGAKFGLLGEMRACWLALSV